MAKSLNIGQRFLLIIHLVILCALSIKLWLSPTTANLTLSSSEYGKIRVENWQNMSQKRLTSSTTEGIVSGIFRGGTKQILTRQTQILTLKLATFSQSNGDLKQYLKNYSDSLFAVAQHDARIGDYALFVNNKHLTMTACLTESGLATLTADQFKVAQIRATFTVKQLWRWLTNRDQLMPHTCHWRSLHLSPMTADANKTLIKIWLMLNNTTAF